jgi:methyl-accepting chemotaxis protein
VEEQNAATSEIARNVQHTAGAAQQVTDNISGVRHAANETGTAASQVSTAASALSNQAAELGTAVRGFVSTVRAA